MSQISITRSALRSQVVRNLVGERIVDIYKDITTPETEEQQEENGVTRRFWTWARGLANRLGRFLVGVVARSIVWLVRSFVSIVVTGLQTFFTFDWNQTDSSIEAQIGALNNQIAEQLGEAVGSGAVWLATIGLAGAAAVKFPVLGGRVAIALAQEGGEELRSQIVSVINISQQALARAFVLKGLLTLRRLRLFGMQPVTTARDPWSIAGAIDNQISRLPDNIIEPFVRGLIQGSVNAIIQAGYVITYAIDDYYTTMNMSNESMFGEQRVVKLQPDRDNENEFVVLRGPQEMVKQNIQNALVTHSLIHNRDVGQIYGIPTQTYQEEVSFKPQIRLMFRQDRDAIPENSTPIEAEISFRLMGETNASITPTKARAIAEKIRSEFATGEGYIWSKGRIQVVYRDSDLGYRLRILAINEQEGTEVINKILDIQGHTFDRNKLSVSIPARASVNSQSGSQVVYGQARPNRRYRPTGRVRFQFAALQVHGLDRDVMLVDRTGRYIDALVRVA